jgi:hypothetical protein
MAKIFISFNIISTSDIILVVREMDAPLAEVYRHFYPAPHTQVNLTVDNLNPVMHIVQAWSTTDGTTLLQLKGQCDIDASIGGQLAFDIVTFIVDRGLTGTPHYDPVTPTNQYANPDLDGKTYTVFKPGYGPLIFGYHIDTIVGGGFHFIDGQEFSSTEEYTIMVSDLVATNTVSSGAGYPKGVVAITADTAFAPAHYGQLLEIVGAGTGVITISIADINTIPDNTVFGINTHNGLQRYVTLQLPSGKYCQILGVQRNAGYISRGQEVTFIKKGAYLRVTAGAYEAFGRVGDRIYKDGAGPLNSLPETGGWYLKADYPGIARYVSELPIGDVVAGTDDVTPGAADVAKWNVGTNKIWVPDAGGYFVRNADPNTDVDIGRSTVSGNIEADMVGPHTHLVTPPDANSNAGFGKTTTGNDAHEGTGIAPYATAANTGTETRPKNVNRYCYIII